MKLLLFALTLVIACKREPVVVRRDPTPPVDAAPAPPLNTRMVLHGRIVDVATGAVVFPLREKTPRQEASDERAAYVLDDDAMLRAWELSTGKQLWSVATSSRLLEMENTRVLLAEGSALIAVAKATGASRKHAAPDMIEEIRAVAGAAVVRSGSTDLTVIDLGSGVLRGTHHAAGRIEDAIDDRTHAIATTRDGFCYVRFTPPDWEVRCLDLSLKETVHTVTSLVKPSDPPGTRMTTLAIGRSHVLIGTFSFGGASAPRRGVVIRLADGKEVVRVEDELVALVETVSGDLEGIIAASPEVRFYTPSGALKWSHKPKWPEHFARVLLHEDRIVAARHNIIATGVDILALRKSDGALLWTGETKLPPIAHSKYHNQVELESRGDAVVLRGHESSVEHVHVYDVATGKLRFHDP